MDDPKPSFRPAWKGKPLLACLALILLTLAIFWPVVRYPFVGYDDNEYVYDNPHVQKGLSAETIRWSMTGEVSAMWHPLTLLSHAAVTEVAGMNAGVHHAVNLLFHLCNVLLLFLLLRNLTGAALPSFLAAALFAVHPMNVDSVAWVSQRKNVLSLFFGLLTVGAYIRYRRTQAQPWLFGALVLFFCSLASKPSMVVLPGILFLLEYWPMGAIAGTTWTQWRRSLLAAFKEVLPFLVLGVLMGIATIGTQGRIGAMVPLSHFPLGVRLAGVPVNYLFYIEKLLWPANLSVYYWRSEGMPSLIRLTASLVVLVSVSGVALAAWRRAPFGLVGWLWFLGSLSPVIGLFASGNTILGDRFVYLPAIGLFVAVAWTLDAAASARPGLRRPLWGVSALLVVALAVAASVQVRYWRSPLVLFNRAVAISPKSAQMHDILGNVYLAQKNPARALEHFQEAARQAPEKALHENNIGCAYVQMGEYEKAEPHFQKALELSPSETLYLPFGKDPTSVLAKLNLAQMALRRKDLQEALRYYESILAERPQHALALQRAAFLRRAIAKPGPTLYPAGLENREAKPASSRGPRPTSNGER